MLQSIRDGLQSHKWLMYIVLGALALIFAAWGAYGIVNFNTGGSSYAAEAGGQKVSIESARTAWINWRKLNKVRWSSMPGAISVIAVSR